MQLIKFPITITISNIILITSLILIFSHVSIAVQSFAESSDGGGGDDYTITSRSDDHHHYELHPPEVPAAAEADSTESPVYSIEDQPKLQSFTSPEQSEPELPLSSAAQLPSEPPPEAPPPEPVQQTDIDAQDEQIEPSTPSAQKPDQTQPFFSEEPAPTSTFFDLLAQYTPSFDGQQTLEDLKSNGLFAYDYLESTILNLATLMPSVLDSLPSDDDSKVEGGGTTIKRPRENYALLSRFSWSALCQYYESLQSLELLCTETVIAGSFILLLILLIIRYCHYRERQHQQRASEDSDPLSPGAVQSPLIPQGSSSGGPFSKLLRYLNFTILLSNLASYVDGAVRSFRSTEAVVNQTSFGNAGVYSMQGRRPNMEDCFTMHNNISHELGIDYYAVYDGHGGPNAALQAEREIFENISRRIKEMIAESNKENNTSQQESKNSNSKSVPSSPTITTSSSESSCPATPSTSSSPLTFSSMLNSGGGKVNLPNHNNQNSHRPFDGLTVNAMKTILHEEITAVDARLVEAFRRRSDISGTTAVIAVRLVQSNILLVANVGDSRAVLCDWKGQAIVLSVDHKPYQLKEYRRIVEAGGYIMLKGVYRVNGILAVSRALGDYPLKEDRLVIADPDILSFDLTELRARFMIVASDGFWDTFSNENAVQFVRGELARHGSPLNMGESQAGLALYLAKRLANEAYTRESYDNITIIVVLFEDVAGGGVQVKGVGQATCPSGSSSPTTKTAPTLLPTAQTSTTT